MSRLRVAIVGAGLMGRWHAVYARRAGAVVSAIVDRREEAARDLARRYRGARAASPTEDWPALSGARVVHVCTPAESHAELVERALDAGLHALVEKPLASSLAEARRLLELARRRGLRLAPVHQLSFQQGVRRLRRRLGELGTPRRIVYRVLSAGGAEAGAERRRSLLLEMLPHAVSLFMALGVAIPAPEAWRLIRLSGDELELATESAVTGLAILISLEGRPTRHELEVIGDRATATADLFHGYCLFESGRTSRRAKILLPFRHGALELGTAAGNLVGRALRRQPAYPGLPELVGAFYRSLVEPGAGIVGEEETLAAAALAEWAGAARVG